MASGSIMGRGPERLRPPLSWNVEIARLRIETAIRWRSSNETTATSGPAIGWKRTTTIDGSVIRTKGIHTRQNGRYLLIMTSSTTLEGDKAVGEDPLPRYTILQAIKPVERKTKSF